MRSVLWRCASPVIKLYQNYPGTWCMDYFLMLSVQVEHMQLWLCPRYVYAYRYNTGSTTEPRSFKICAVLGNSIYHEKLNLCLKEYQVGIWLQKPRVSVLGCIFLSLGLHEIVGFSSLHKADWQVRFVCIYTLIQGTQVVFLPNVGFVVLFVRAFFCPVFCNYL